MNTAGFAPSRTGTLPSSLMSETIEFSDTIGMDDPIRALPDGLIVLVLRRASTTSVGDMLWARRRSGSRWMTMDRSLPPKGGGAEMPGIEENIGRIRFTAKSWSSVCDLVSLVKTRLPTGTLPASNRMTKGGTDPLGMNRCARWIWLMVSAMALAMSVPG